MSDLIEFYGAFESGRAYGYRDPIYAGGWHRGQDIPGLEWGTRKVPLLRPGKLHHITRQYKVGLVYVYDVGGGEFDSYCHTFALAGGFRLARSISEAPGASWEGPHLHLVRSRYADAAYNTSRPVLDPRPIIRAALADPAGEEDEVTEDDINKIADAVTDRILNYAMHGGAELSTGGTIPRETLADRIREIRRRATVTNNLVKRVADKLGVDTGAGK